MSEQTIQEGIQDVIQAMSAFADADVVINDWTVLDGESATGPWVIILNSDDFRSRQDTTTPQDFWNIPIILYEPFSDWQTTLNNFRTRRQALIDEFNKVSDNRAADGLSSTTIDEFRDDGDIEYWYDPYIPSEQVAEALPDFIFQRIIAEVEEYG